MQCPNCKTPCVGCAGARITTASNGATVCTKCVASYELTLGKNPTPVKTSNTVLNPNVNIAPTNIEIKYNPPKL